MKNWQSGHLAERLKRCYVCFARNEDKMISPDEPDLCAAADRSELSYAAFENAGPSWPDFSEPIYAHIEYI